MPHLAYINYDAIIDRFQYKKDDALTNTNKMTCDVEMPNTHGKCIYASTLTLIGSCSQKNILKN